MFLFFFNHLHTHLKIKSVLYYFLLIAGNDYCCGLKERLQKKCWNHHLNKEITQRAYFYFSVMKS